MSSEVALGKLAFSSIQQAFKLSTCIRKSGDDQQGFRNLLDDLALEISKNSKVMLRRNLWVEASLVNGSLGTITDIIHEVGRRPLPSQRY